MIELDPDGEILRTLAGNHVAGGVNQTSSTYRLPTPSTVTPFG